MRDFVWPRGGWARAFEYVKHRVRRLPDTPERISRGIWAGVFTAFTPFYGLHFVVAAVLARIMRGNILSALMGTFFGNPLTYIPIGVVSLGTGYSILGMPMDRRMFTGGGEGHCGIACRFSNAFNDLKHNFEALFSRKAMDWHGLADFWTEVFWPYLVGGLAPGVIAATVCYYLSVPVISAYQNRRRKKLRKKLGELGKKTANMDGSDAPKG